MNSAEIESVQQFVDDAMQDRYGCNAYPLPELVLVARCSEKILGTIAISKPAHGRLPLEARYVLDAQSFPGGTYPGANAVIQFGRWVGQEAYVSAALMYAAVDYSLKEHYAWAISEVKPQVARRFRRMGIGLSIVSASMKWPELIPLAIRPYYHRPHPVLAVASLEEMERILRRFRIPDPK